MPRRAVRLMALLVAGCSDGAGPGPIQSCASDQEVNVTVSNNEVPLFTWDPPCGLSSLTVWDQNQTSGWVLFTGSRSAENPLRSGIRYGVAPPEALEPAPASPLTSDSYTVTVYRWIGEPDAGSHFPVGSATFSR